MEAALVVAWSVEAALVLQESAGLESARLEFAGPVFVDPEVVGLELVGWGRVEGELLGEEPAGAEWLEEVEGVVGGPWIAPARAPEGSEVVKIEEMDHAGTWEMPGNWGTLHLLSCC